MGSDSRIIIFATKDEQHMLEKHRIFNFQPDMQLTDAMYTAPCTGLAAFLCARPHVRLSSVAYVHDIVFALRISHGLLNVHVKLLFAVLYVSLNDGTYTLWNGSFFTSYM